MNNKDENDLLTLLKLHCPEGVEIALPQTYKELLKKTMPSLGLLNLQASEPCEPRCEPCEPFMRVFFFLQLVWEVVDFSPRNIDLAPDYH